MATVFCLIAGRNTGIEITEVFVEVVVAFGIRMLAK